MAIPGFPFMKYLKKFRDMELYLKVMLLGCSLLFSVCFFGIYKICNSPKHYITWTKLAYVHSYLHRDDQGQPDTIYLYDNTYDAKSYNGWVNINKRPGFLIIGSPVYVSSDGNFISFNNQTLSISH